jgi:REP element-mobilizing transposase RayT
MSTKYKIGENEIPHFISFSVVHWIDALTRNEYKDILAGSLQYCRKEKGMKLHAWILMSNHVHLVLSCRQGFLIRDCLRDLKNIPANKSLKLLKIP